MNGSVIEYILENNPYTSKYYHGFGTFDLELPRTFRKPAIYILNTDRWYGAGEHWCVANFVSDQVCEFFDSYGQPPCYYNFDKILYPHVENIVYNSFRVQGLQPTCGHHCLLYTLFRYYGYSASFILNNIYAHKTAADLKTNDMIAYNYISQYFGNVYAQFV